MGYGEQVLQILLFNLTILWANLTFDLTIKDERRLKCLEEIEANRLDRQSRRSNQRKLQTAQFIKSMQMLQANAKSDSSEPFEDYSLFVYRQTAPDFQDRVKDLERKFTYVPVRNCCFVVRLLHGFFNKKRKESLCPLTIFRYLFCETLRNL